MKRGEIWLVNLDPTVGAEIQKTRPCVIVNDDTIGTLPLKIIAPLTDGKERYRTVPWMVMLDPDTTNGLVKTSAIDLFQVRSVAEERLAKKVGSVSNAALAGVAAALKTVFSIR
jgi:mRNA interferase MazF